VGQLSNALLVVYLADVAISVWRRGDRRRAVTVVGSMLLFIAAAATHAALVNHGKVRSPYIVIFFFLGLILAMGYELNRNVLGSREMARKLQTSAEELRDSEERLRLAAKAASIGIWAWDIPRNDPGASSMTRAVRKSGESEQIGFGRFLSSVHPDDREGMQESIEKAVAERTEFEREYRVQLPDGQTRWMAARGAVERDSAGAAVRMRGVSLDVTPQKEVELELLQQRSELAHLARVTMVGELSGSLAHELNQPLTAILSNAQAAQQLLAVDAPDLGEVREILGDIVAEDKRAGEVIQRLRLLLRKGEVNRQPLDVSEVVEDVLKIMRSDLVNHRVTVAVAPSPDLPAVSGDRVQLQQVLLNLVLNGCDAMRRTAPGERRLYVRTERNGDGSVHVLVADRGCGIPGEKLGGVFEPFFTTKPHGLGLGLAVCRSIIRAHGGEIWATNNVPDAAGATFHFSLPAAAARS
jgi:PAS domain S-box-containing protein